ncbi:hypothetical protein FSP39_019954 [Pinctada imbricata]|uniref:Mutator-like transposase domain-containing protein n=1 Tax=Pinctada imbricata TaxID=66713 RepID=A0AA89CB34_PINIB|nr:hypothetical protein FSP39_019954 [Pinctada imbricata]
MTSDGDSKLFAGLKSFQKGHCEPLKDIRHLSLSMKRQIANAPFSSTAFSGRNKSALQNRFAKSVKARCIAELTKTVQACRRNLKSLKKTMPGITEAIISCYKKNYGHTCSEQSYACKEHMEHYGKRVICQQKQNKDDEWRLRLCLEIMLDDESLEKVRFLTSSQNAEAFNKTIAVQPKVEYMESKLPRPGSYRKKFRKYKCRREINRTRKYRLYEGTQFAT